MSPYPEFGKDLPACTFFCTVVNGMPLVYGGQEAGLNKSLKFFDKDTIEWKDYPNAALYNSLFKLKHENQPLWNGGLGGEMVRIFNDKPCEIISFAREKMATKWFLLSTSAINL